MGVTVTKAATVKISELLQREGKTDYGLRIAVVGGGCSGFQYGMAFEEAPQKGDEVIEEGGVRLFIDPMSASYLNDANIDYVESLEGSGFRIDNPQAKSSCACGQSFSA